jgi:ketosteroid isomerase-like protein
MWRAHAHKRVWGFEMSEVDDFLSQTMPRLMEAERALHNGDAEPRLAMWSRNDPVTLFGAWLSDTGWEDVSRTFQVLASRFSDCTAYDVDIVAAGASGDLAYTVAYEHTTASVQGVPRTYTLRVTQIYRREDGDWKLAHRHGDELAADQQPLNTTPAT